MVCERPWGVYCAYAWSNPKNIKNLNGKKMIRIGMIGMNGGNGHPYSYAAIFNGYDEAALMKLCPFDLIKEYLPKEHCNQVHIPNARVTHIWTQDKTLSGQIAQVSLIPNIVDNIEDLLTCVDAVILARDDTENHLTMALPFIKVGMPIFIDKQLTSSKEDYNIFQKSHFQI